MALGGDLRNINLADIFQTLSMNRQVGTLVVRNGIKEKHIFFSGQGVSLSSGRTIPGFRLGKYLLGSGQLSHEDLRAALAEQRRTGDLLGKILTTLGFCTKEDVEEVIRYHAAEELYEIFTWKEGEFEFLEGTSAESLDRPSPYALTQFDAGGIVMEAARRMDEWSRFREIFPTDDDFVVRTGKAGEQLSPEDWDEDFVRVYELVDGTHSVHEILDEYHLAAYDTGILLRDLAMEGLVRLSTLSELTKAAWEYLDQHNVGKATKCLERAHAVDPRDASILRQLTQCYERLDEKRSAAACLVSTARLQLEEGQAAAAIEALEKAEKFDPGSEEAPLLLIQAYRDNDDLEAVAEKARAAAAILCDKQEFDRAVELCREGLDASPGHTGLRIVLANAWLGLGEKEPALDELESIAAALEETRNYRRLEEVYKKILQLDSSRREYLRRLQELKEGEIRRRRRLVRIAGMAVGGVVLLLVSLFVFTGGTSAQERLGMARESMEKGDFARATALADAILAEVDDTSDEWFQASVLKREIDQRRIGGGKPDRTAQAAKEIETRIESCFAAASPFFRDEDYPRGVEELARVTSFLGSDDYRRLRKEAGDATVRKIEDEYRNTLKSVLQAWAEQMEGASGIARGELTPLEEVKLPAADPERVAEVMESAKAVRDRVAPEVRRRAIERAESVEIAFGVGNDRVTPRLRKASDALDQVHEKAFRLYHRARSLVRRGEVRARFDSAMSEVTDLKNGGRIDAALAALREFLLVCEDLGSEKPEEFYAPVVADLLGAEGLDLKGKARAEFDRLTGVKEALARAETLVGQGRYQEANDLFRETIHQNLLIDFGDLIRLCANVRTRPVGARVSLRWDGGEPRVLGNTGPDGLLVRYPPYGETVVTASLETFEPAHLRIESYDDVKDAEPRLELTKIPEWRWGTAGPIQASPEIWATALLVASRDGHLRAIRRETGELLFDLDTKLLSGFAARPVVRGSTAYLASLDGTLIALDLEKRQALWTAEIAERLRTAPLFVGDLLVVADESGTVFGLRNGEVVWRQELSGRVQGDPVAVGEDVLVGTTEGHLVRLHGTDGSVVWDVVPGGRIYASLVADGAGNVFVGTDGSEALCIAAADGSVTWRAETDNAVRGHPALREGEVIVSTLAGTIYRLDRATGKVRGRVSVPGDRGMEGGVAFGRGHLYFVDAAGVLHAFDLAHGEDWSFSVGGGSLAAPRVRDDFVYIATGDGAVYCFRE